MSLGDIGWAAGMGVTRAPGMWGLAQLADLGDDPVDWGNVEVGLPPTPVTVDPWLTITGTPGIAVDPSVAWGTVTPATAPAAIAKLPNGTFDITKLMPVLAAAIKAGTQLALPPGSYMQTDAAGNTVLVKQPVGTPINFASGAGQLGGTLGLGLSSSLSGMLPILLIGGVVLMVMSRK